MRAFLESVSLLRQEMQCSRTLRGQDWGQLSREPCQSDFATVCVTEGLDAAAMATTGHGK